MKHNHTIMLGVVLLLIAAASFVFSQTLQSNSPPNARAATIAANETARTNPCVIGITQSSVNAYLKYLRAVDVEDIRQGRTRAIYFQDFAPDSVQAKIQKASLADISNPSGRFWALTCHPPKRLSNIQLKPDYLSLAVGRTASFTPHVLQADETGTTPRPATEVTEPLECVSNDMAVATVETVAGVCQVKANKRGVTTVFARLTGSPSIKSEGRGVAVR